MDGVDRAPSSYPHHLQCSVRPRRTCRSRSLKEAIMNPISSIGTALSMLLLATVLTSCAKPEQKPTAKLSDTLPDIVVTVNGVRIERATVLERLAQAQSMTAHQQHMAQMDQMAAQGAEPKAGQPQNTGASTSTGAAPTVHDPAHVQSDADLE